MILRDSAIAVGERLVGDHLLYLWIFGGEERRGLQ